MGGLISSSAAMKCLILNLLLLCNISKPHAQDHQMFDIMKFGGESDGLTDNSKVIYIYIYLSFFFFC